MYLHHEIYTINAGRQRELEQRVPRLHAMMQADGEGFVSAHFLRAGGDLSKYVALRVWRDQAANRAWGRSPQMQEYLRNRPEGSYTRPPEIEYYELATEAKGPAPDHFTLEVEFDITPGTGRAFEALHAEYLPIMAAQPGVHAGRLWRFAGNQTRYLRISDWESREHLLALMESADRKRMAEAEATFFRTPSKNAWYELLPGSLGV